MNTCKKIISLLLVLTLLLGVLVACKDTGGTDPQEPQNPQEPSAHMLDGKRVLFIGNSFTYYGKCVLEKKQSVRTQAERDNDKGYFYELCKQNGAEVSVTNWTWGGHTLEDTFGGSCAADRGCNGVDHLAALTNRSYDYVIIQEGSSVSENIVSVIEEIMAIFKAANPDVKFLCIAQSNHHFQNNTTLLSALKTLEEKGMTIVDWGKLVADIVNGEVSAPGAAEIYNKNSFIVCKSAADGYHPNMLTGYITALFVYCAITGEKAEGQPYAFCDDKSVNSKFDTVDYCNDYYTYNNATTNFPEIFNSDADMKGIQQLIDTYLAAKAYRNY
ncbi:MAG: hypothetical protein IJW51_07665 [Clostridia bacterium]|nr:hypothetical protein [Clostridia bacterium]